MRGEELTPWMIRYGYERGAFPMTMENGLVEWFQPRKRCLFPIEGIHVSRSLAKKIERDPFDIRFDTAFEQVMRSCFRPEDNWLSEDFVRAYGEIHRQGWGHCAECWLDGELVGGVYGIALGSCFCAESMFHRATDASKIALWAMINRCRELGFTIFDAQIMNPHLDSLGAYEVPHLAFEIMLSDALKRATQWSALPSK
ncbi:MAG: leucyl/phenylalanyl-tRNA--protein transferase [Fimbriimonas sp.]|nr:leucyl/phenylalanyl-tRNA--protein transferase [Fimbriimonas sp.]